MTTTRTRPRPPHPRASQRLAIDPYRVEDIAWTREEILAARGYRPAASRPSASRRASGRRCG